MRRIRTQLLVVLGSGLAALLAACGTSDPTPTPTAEPTATPGGVEDPTPEGFEAEWDALIAAAQGEGRIVVAGTGGSIDPFVEVYRHWGEKFGIHVALGLGGGSEVGDRILAEQGAGRFDVDTIHVGLTTLNTRLIPNNAVEPPVPLLFHPEVTDMSAWYGEQFYHLDIDGDKAITWQGRVGVSGGLSAWVNTNLVSVEEMESWTSWRDILNERYAGQILSTAPTTIGIGIGWVAVYDSPHQGREWFEALYGSDDLEIFFTDDHRFLAESLADGSYKIAYQQAGEAGRQLEQLRDLGLPVEEYATFRDEMGWPLYDGILELVPGGGNCCVMVGRNAPHPNAAKLFLNWFLSREGQTFVHDLPDQFHSEGLHNRVSLREDIPPGLTDPAFRRQPGAVYDMTRYDAEAPERQVEIHEWVREMHLEVMAQRGR